jgi:hypothetical protein
MFQYEVFRGFSFKIALALVPSGGGFPIKLRVVTCLGLYVGHRWTIVVRKHATEHVTEHVTEQKTS